ncbi:MAG: acetyl-CoA C-acetyltransferase [Acidobacteriota bacterium]|nr:acetyl-CoA C-acetyltransferase [Acidobacteriota bacterium]MDQ3418069.1 acetyl-CoA C-acetyltransferase [Acidobacteriota bacterium]
MTHAVILSACRTPIGSFGGTLKDLSAADLGAIVIREAITRAGVDAAAIGDVIMGCVLQGGAGMNVARQASLKAGVPVEVPAETVNRVCGSGLQAVVHAVEAVRSGYMDLAIGGGTESMSNAPYIMRGARWGYRMGNGELIDSLLAEGLTCSIKGCHMGNTAEEIVKRLDVSRVDQDAFAAESQRRAGAAIEAGAFSKEIVAVEIPQKKGPAVRMEKDEYPRPGTTAEKLGALKAAFAKEGTVTAGNASGINDGAAALVIATEEKAAALGRKPLARILSYCTTGVDPMIMGMGPVEALKGAARRANLSLADLDLFELNEAFASQSLAVSRELKLDPAKVNVHGGAIALGHPLGASGARILTTLVHALQARGGGRGAAALCVGGGMGTAMIVEAI